MNLKLCMLGFVDGKDQKTTNQTEILISILIQLQV